MRRVAPALSCIAATILAVALVQQGQSSWIEASAFVSGVIWVWLAAEASFWNFPIGMLNALVSVITLAQKQVYADATLYAVFFVLLAFGWWEWKFGGEKRSERPIAPTPRVEALWVGGATVALWVATWALLRRLGGYFPVWDGLGFSLSLAAQYLQSRKFIENWPGWVVVNALYVGLCIARDLKLFAALYAIFLVMSFVGWADWRRLRVESA